MHLRRQGTSNVLYFTDSRHLGTTGIMGSSKRFSLHPSDELTVWNERSKQVHLKQRFPTPLFCPKTTPGPFALRCEVSLEA